MDVVWYIAFNPTPGIERFGNFDPTSFDLLRQARVPEALPLQIWEVVFPPGADTEVSVRMTDFVLNQLKNLGTDLAKNVAFKLVLRAPVA